MTAVNEVARAVKTHISINVSDVDRSAAFYEAFFGVPAHKRRPGYANFDLADPPLKFALQQHAPQAGVGSLSHLGLQVATTEQVQAAKARLEASGLVTFDETDTTCCHARQEKVWVHDPNGNAWEIYVLLDDMRDEHGHEQETSGAACCAASALAKAGGPPCCDQPADGAPCCA